MKKYFLLIIAAFFGVAINCQTPQIPHLINESNTYKLVVEGKPFLILGGELHNSSTSGESYMRPIWANMASKNLNTVIAPVYWELIEPEEGRFDFSLVDSMLAGARSYNLKIVILWFATWKNGYSMYAPEWIKKDQEKYPRAKSKDGQVYQMLSAFGENSMNADARAFKMLMKHIREADEKYQTVITVQIENEMGLFYTDRDYRDEATKAYNGNVPADLMKYISTNRGRLQPEIDSVLKVNGYKTSGSWETVFGKSSNDRSNWKNLPSLTEELFTVYHYAKYIEKIASEGKKEYPIPMYVNAWIKQPGTGMFPGRYPNGGPIPHTLDIWRAAAPSIDFIAPDIYVIPSVAMYTIEQYHRPGNPVFIPEFRHGVQSAHFAFWAYGQHDALAFAPFGIDDWTPEEDAITLTYAALSQVKHLILEHHGKGTMAGIYLDTLRRSQDFNLGAYKIRAQLGGGSYAELAGLAGRSRGASSAGGMVFSIGRDEFLIIGKDFRLTFNPLKPDEKKPNIDVVYMDEGTFIDGKWVTLRRLNGDEGTGGGDYGFGTGKPVTSGSVRFSRQPGDAYSIIRFKMYRY